MISAEEIHKWVQDFADSVIQQTEAIQRGDHRTANKYAKRYIAAFGKIRTIGNAGRDALASLLTHSRGDVRVMAATFLLRHRTEDALEVLRAEATGEGIVAFGASEAIKRWEEGTWTIDPL